MEKLTIHFIAFVLAAQLAQADVVEDYEKAKKAGDKALAAFFADSEKTYAEEARFYSLKSQFLWKKAANEGVIISTKPAGKGEFVIQGLDGKAVGSIAPGKKEPDPKLAEETIATIHQAIRRFPDRLDFRIGLAGIFQELNKHDDLFEVYENTCEHIAKNPKNKFQGRDDSGKEIYEVIDVDPAESIGGAIHRHCRHFWAFENEVGDENMHRLAELSAKHFPNRPQAWNMLAAYHSFKKNTEKMFESLKNAHKADPKDEIVLSNLAKASADHGKTEEAVAYYEKIVDVSKSPNRKAQAEAALKKLRSESSAEKK